MKNIIKQFQISLDHNILEICWNDCHVSRFHSKWLRFNCQCEACTPAFAFDYRVDIASFSKDLKIKEVKTSDEGKLLEIVYDHDLPENHVTVHKADWLRSKCYCDGCLETKICARDVISQHLEKSSNGKVFPKIDYKEILENKDLGTFKWIKHVIEDGYCLIKNVPVEGDKVVEIAESVSYVEETNYGKVWVVKHKNIDDGAYTSNGLPFHQDLMMHEVAAGVQFLHAIRFESSIIGGESMLADLFEAVEIIRKESPDDFKTLVEVPVTYIQSDYVPVSLPPMHMEHQKHQVTLDYFGKIVGCVWHPGISGPLQVREKDVDRYYKAHCKMAEILKRKDVEIRFKLSPGDCLVFNNRRMVHAREAFENHGGSRELQGLYIKLDELKSKYLVLAKKLNYDVTVPKVGNNSSM